MEITLKIIKFLSVKLKIKMVYFLKHFFLVSDIKEETDEH